MRKLYRVISSVYVFWAMVVLLSCTVQNKLDRKFLGQKEEVVIGQMGKPVEVTQLDHGKKVDIFEKRTRLNKAPINTGQFQYDRLESPESTKIETFTFTINASGIIEKVHYEYRYER